MRSVDYNFFMIEKFLFILLRFRLFSDLIWFEPICRDNRYPSDSSVRCLNCGVVQRRERERELLQAQLVHVENSWNYSMALNRREWIRFTPNQYGMRWTADTMELIIDFKRVCGDVYLYRRTEYISSVVTFLQIDSLIFKYVLAVGMCQ